MFSIFSSTTFRFFFFNDMDSADMSKGFDLRLDEAEELDRMLSQVEDNDGVGAGVVLIASSRG